MLVVEAVASRARVRGRAWVACWWWRTDSITTQPMLTRMISCVVSQITNPPKIIIKTVARRKLLPLRIWATKTNSQSAMGLQAKDLVGQLSNRMCSIAKRDRSCSIHSWRKWPSPSIIIHRYKCLVRDPLWRRKTKETMSNRCEWCQHLHRDPALN